MTDSPAPTDPRAIRRWWGWLRHIMRRDQPYMDRYSLRRQLASGHNPWRAYINHFLAPDDPGYHDHPSKWSFSIILWGSYTEEYLEWPDYFRGDLTDPPVAPVICTRRVRWWNWIPAGRYHRIAKLHPSRFGGRGVVTLFFCGPLTGRPWGFWVAGKGHVPYEPPTPGPKTP